MYSDLTSDREPTIPRLDAVPGIIQNRLRHASTLTLKHNPTMPRFSDAMFHERPKKACKGLLTIETQVDKVSKSAQIIII